MVNNLVFRWPKLQNHSFSWFWAGWGPQPPWSGPVETLEDFFCRSFYGKCLYILEWIPTPGWKRLEAWLLHPEKLTWNPTMEVWKMIVLFSWHVNFQGWGSQSKIRQCASQKERISSPTGIKYPWWICYWFKACQLSNCCVCFGVSPDVSRQTL